jgi:hypothetical protein
MIETIGPARVLGRLSYPVVLLLVLVLDLPLKTEDEHEDEEDLEPRHQQSVRAGRKLAPLPPPPKI